MLRGVMLILMAAVMLTACGVKRPLIAPKDIPAHQAKRQKKLDQYQQEEDEDAAKAKAAGQPESDNQ